MSTSMPAKAKSAKAKGKNAREIPMPRGRGELSAMSVGQQLDAPNIIFENNQVAVRYVDLPHLKLSNLVAL